MGQRRNAFENVRLAIEGFEKDYGLTLNSEIYLDTTTDLLMISVTSQGNRAGAIDHYEPYEGFPSDELVAKVMLASTK